MRCADSGSIADRPKGRRSLASSNSAKLHQVFSRPFPEGFPKPLTLRDRDQRDGVGESNAGSGVPKFVKRHQRCAPGSGETRTILH
jgi:hypothetical protein